MDNNETRMCAKNYQCNPLKGSPKFPALAGFTMQKQKGRRSQPWIVVKTKHPPPRGQELRLSRVPDPTRPACPAAVYIYWAPGRYANRIVELLVPSHRGPLQLAPFPHVIGVIGVVAAVPRNWAGF